MINEENKIPATEQATEDATQPEFKKKLSTPVLVGIIAGAVAIIALVVILCVVPSGGCKEHIDANDDFLCDNCGDDFNDGIEVVTADVTFSVKLDDGTSLAGVGFYLTREEKDPIRLETGADGKVTHTLEGGQYTIEYDYETISSFMSSDTYTVTVVENMAEVVITLSDNTPDGSAEKPFYISENETEISLEPGAELHFNYRGAATKYLTINNADLVVIYDGVEYTPVDGVIEVTITPKEIGVSTAFVIKNISDSAVNEVMSFIAPLGSMENPYNLNEEFECQTVPAEGTIYYKWTADKTGVIVLRVEDHTNNFVAITRILENDVPISASSAGDTHVYMPVSAGDVITITASTNSKEDVTVNFNGTVYSADESDPVDIFAGALDITFMAGQSLSFACQEGQTVEIENEEGITVTYNGNTYTPDENGKISFIAVSGCELFTVTNNNLTVNNMLIICD